MARYELRIPDWHPLSANRRERGRWLRNKCMRLDKDMVRAYALTLNIPAALGKRRVSATFAFGRGKRRCDVDNLLKSLFDALHACRLIIDDNPRWLAHGPFECVKADCSETIIILEDIDGDADTQRGVARSKAAP